MLAALAAFVYAVLLLDLGTRAVHPVTHVVTALIAAAIVGTYLVMAPRAADRFDRWLLTAFLLFLPAAVLSAFPRQSLDAVLGALLALAAIFIARGLLVEESARRLLMTTLMALSAIFVLVTAAQWLPAFLAWWSLTNWEIAPPLDLRLISAPWGYRHDIALLVVMLYPSWWTGDVGRVRAAAAVGIGLLTLAIVIVDGSRTVWLAVVIGAVAAGARSVRPSALRRRGVVIASFALALMVLGALAGGAIVERAVRGTPIEQRGEMWSATIEAWSNSPLVGLGPGSFPWLLQTTDYFDTNSLAPRHPDNALVQLVGEGGLLGLASAIVVAATVVPAVFRSGSRGSIFAVVVAVVSTVALNPTVLAFTVAVGIAWTAYAVPRPPPDAEAPPHPPRRLVQLARIGAMAVIALALLSVTIGHVAYESARRALLQEEYGVAEQQLALASTLDPAMAIYHRQLGALRLVSGSPGDALEPLRRSVELNPSDDLAWRTNALALELAGNHEAALAASADALRAQRSDSSNLLVHAWLQLAGGDEDGARQSVVEVVQAWPLIVVAPGWEAFFDAESVGSLVPAALERWRDGEPSPEPLRTQPAILTVLSGMEADLSEPGMNRISSTLWPLYVRVHACPTAGEDLANEPRGADLRTSEYWALRVRQEAANGQDGEEPRLLYRIMTGDDVLSEGAPDPFLNPLHENGLSGNSADVHGYRRLPMEWPSGPLELPSLRAGIAAWHDDPRGSAARMSLEPIASVCEGDGR